VRPCVLRTGARNARLRALSQLSERAGSIGRLDIRIHVQDAAVASTLVGSCGRRFAAVVLCAYTPPLQEGAKK